MSIHKECGTTIRWARRSDDPERFNAPLEFNDFAFIIDEAGTAIEVTTYRVHECNASDVENWQRNKANVAKALGKETYELGGYELYSIKREEKRKEDWKVALRVECEVCGAPPRKKCVSKAKGPKFGTKIRNPHPRRLDLGMSLL